MAGHNCKITRNEIIKLFLADNAQDLYHKADSVRKEHKGDLVHLRGIIEFSNFCKKNCNYCGIGSSNKNVRRYRMSSEEILEICKSANGTGIKTVVLQSGEDAYYTKELMGDLIAEIKDATGLIVTLSVGERDEDTFRYWKERGMDRYLLRFETSSMELFKKCHPDDDLVTRLGCLEKLKKIGIETGSGFLIGLPGQTIEELADDIIFCTDLNLDMIGVGPFISHPDTSFGVEDNPFDKEIFYRTIAMLRILNPQANIPATTAFDAIERGGRDKVLQAGANVFMPNITPAKYRKDYLLYPNKPCVDEGGGECLACAESRISGLGRKIV
jgi:biotin synthase